MPKSPRWAQLAPFVTKLRLRFDPVDARATGLKELWKHSEGPRIRAACPNYEVAVELDETLCEPTAHVLFANETEVAVDAKDKSVSDIVEEMLEPAYELMMEDEVKGIER